MTTTMCTSTCRNVLVFGMHVSCLFVNNVQLFIDFYMYMYICVLVSLSLSLFAGSLCVFACLTFSTLSPSHFDVSLWPLCDVTPPL